MRRSNLLLTVAVAIGIAGCGAGTPMTVDGTTILRHGFLQGSPGALLTGTIHFRGGCVWADAFGETQVVVWPAEAQLARLDGRLVVLVDDIVLEDGDPISIGGGQYSDVDFIRELAGSIPEACAAKLYWLGTAITP